MKIKGTAFLARRFMLERELGKPRFDAWFATWLAAHPAFPPSVLATSLITWRTFIDFNDAVLHEFFHGDERSYWRFGAGSADWALTQGPYKHLVDKHSIAEFAASAPNLYRNYFTEGKATATVSGTTAELVIDDIEPAFHHVYMEYAIMGYFERGLELVSGQAVTHQRLDGFSSKGARVHYRFRVG